MRRSTNPTMNPTLILTALLCLAAAFARAEDTPVVESPQGNVTVHPIEHATLVLEAGDARIAFDPVGGADGSPALENLDVAFVCMNLPYTMDVERAADAVVEMEPRVVYPYHYRGQEGMSDVGRFEQLVNAENDAIEVRQLDWYPGE